MIPDIREVNFPEYATLSSAVISLNDMGECVITTQVEIDGDIKPDFSYNWEVEFLGERYIHSLHSPQALKDNTSIKSKIDLTFQHWVIYELKRHYFVELTSISSGTAIPDKYITPLGLSVTDFVTVFQNVLNYYYKGAIKINLNPNIEYSQERAFINISYSYIWDVLQEFYNVYGVRWYIKDDTIYVGYPINNISHVFEYGYENGLISIERQVQDADIRNILLGRGGSTNLPQYYFKKAPEGSLYASDPDAIPELEYVFFSELRDKTFRDYVQGWKTNPNRDTKNGTIEIESYDTHRAEIDFAYKKGHEDKSFDPIEYVKDDASIAKYGELQGGLDNNNEIYPSIQNISLEGIGTVNELVAVEKVVSDNVEQAVDNNAVTSTTPDLVQTIPLAPQMEASMHLEYNFEVEEGLTGTLFYDAVLKANIRGTEIPVGKESSNSRTWLQVKEDVVVSIYNDTTGGYYDGRNLPSGNYLMSVDCKVFNPRPTTEVSDGRKDLPTNAVLSVSNIKLIQSKFTDTSEDWKPTFDIWVKNIWQTKKLSTETEQEYADRVWLPILGDEGREAMVTFSSGWLSSSKSWEFLIVKGGYAYDTSKSYNGIPSHWRLTLRKSDAEVKSTGKYIPNIGVQAVAGDKFFFTGIDMQHQYVLFAEKRIKEWKVDNLNKTKDINPTWVAKLDKVRINQLENEDTLLIDKIQVGALVNIRDKRFIDGVLSLYIQSVTYNYTERLIADIDIVLSDKIIPVLNPVQKLNGEIDSLSIKVANQSTELLNMVRQMCDALYLRKDGVEDLSKSPTSFNALVKSGDFRGGIVGGRGWGLFRDVNGNSIAEFDVIRARSSFVTNEFIRNTTKYQGGTQIYSAAEIEVSRVVENENDYECYFDQKSGSVANMFAVDDVAYSQLFNPQNNTIKVYKRRVIEVGLDFIKLSKTDQFGEGVPEEKDIVIHYGNYTDENRQYVIIRDIIGGGYDRMVSNLNSVVATGKEYYFAGREYGGSPRWFVGDSEGDYASWRDGKMSIKGEFVLKDSDITVQDALTGLKSEVDQSFEIQDGKLRSVIGTSQNLFDKGGYLYNASFINGLDGWITSNSENIYFDNDKLVHDNGKSFTDSISIHNDAQFDDLFYLKIKDGWVEQPNWRFESKPKFVEGSTYNVKIRFDARANTEGAIYARLGYFKYSYPVTTEKNGDTLRHVYNNQTFIGVQQGSGYGSFVYTYDDFDYITIREYVITAWENIGYNGELGADEYRSVTIGKYIAFNLYGATNDVYTTSAWVMIGEKKYKATVQYGGDVSSENENKILPVGEYYKLFGSATNQFETITFRGTWLGTENFVLGAYGDVDIHGITVYTEELDVKYRTLFEQTDKLLLLATEMVDEDGTIKASGLVLQSEFAGLFSNQLKAEDTQAMLSEIFDEKLKQELEKEDASLLTTENFIKWVNEQPLEGSYVVTKDNFVTAFSQARDDNDKPISAGFLATPKSAGLVVANPNGVTGVIEVTQKPDSEGKYETTINLTSSLINIDSDNFSVDIEGNMTCKNGNFEGKVIAHEGLFSGFVRTGTWYINNDNFDDYFEKTALNTREMSLAQVSPITILEYQIEPSVSYYINFPSVDGNTASTGNFSRDKLEYFRSYIGCNALIYNYTSKEVNLSYVKHNGEKTNYTLAVGGVVQLTCKINFLEGDTKGYEYTYWEIIKDGKAIIIQ